MGLNTELDTTGLHNINVLDSRHIPQFKNKYKNY